MIGLLLRPLAASKKIVQNFELFPASGKTLAERLRTYIRKLVKPVFHFNRIVAKRSVFLCFLTTRVELMTWKQKKMLRYVTIEVENRLNMYKAECQITGDCAKENQEDAT